MILKREVEKYQVKINEKRAYGECYTKEALVYCEDKLKPISEVKENDLVFVLDVQNKTTSFDKVLNKIEYQHKGKIIRIQEINPDIKTPMDEEVTPNHGYPVFWVNEDNEFFGFKTPAELEELSKSEDGKKLCIRGIDRNHIVLSNLVFSERDYDDMVYCIETPTHTFGVCVNGCSH